MHLKVGDFYKKKQAAKLFCMFFYIFRLLVQLAKLIKKPKLKIFNFNDFMLQKKLKCPSFWAIPKLEKLMVYIYG